MGMSASAEEWKLGLIQACSDIFMLCHNSLIKHLVVLIMLFWNSHAPWNDEFCKNKYLVYHYGIIFNTIYWVIRWKNNNDMNYEGFFWVYDTSNGIITSHRKTMTPTLIIEVLWVGLHWYSQVHRKRFCRHLPVLYEMLANHENKASSLWNSTHNLLFQRCWLVK